MMGLLNSGNLKVFDLQQKLNDEFLITFGEAFVNEGSNEYFAKEKALYNKEDSTSQQGLDYIFVANESENCIDKSSLQFVELKRKEFFVEGKPYTQLSDHFGVELKLKVYNLSLIHI